MSGVSAAGPASDPRPKPPASQAVPGAKQALAKAEGRVDADRRAHSPACVAVDQKGIEAASAAVAQAESMAQTQTQTQENAVPNSAVSIVV